MTSASVLTDEEKQILKTEGIFHNGLSTQEAKHKMLQYGRNVIIDRTEKTFLIAFFSKFANPLIIILLIASFLSVFTKDFIDFIIIFLIIFVSVVVDFIQEYQSQKAAEKLKQRVLVKTLVLRDGEKKEIEVSNITVGDIVFLETGDIIPADIEVLFSNELHADESSFTGESFPCKKKKNDFGFMGSPIVNGEGIGIVRKIGVTTQYGKIANKLGSNRPTTDFEKGIKQFGFLMAQFTFVLVIIIFFINAFFKHNIYESFLFALALAVGMTPELLPIILTVNLAKGAMRMSKKGVIVKHLPSIQNFGSMNILCTDKTGTITANKITLERYENIHQQDDKRVLQYAYLNSSFQSNMKNPLDDAILAHKEVSISGFKEVGEIPFDFYRKRLSVVAKNNNEIVLISKGAPEEMIKVIKYFDNEGKVSLLNNETKKKITERFMQLSNDGFRVLTVAYSKLHSVNTTYTIKDENDLIFLGFTAFLDPPKKGIKEILQTIRQNGLTIKILTGDNEHVTRKICSELDISTEKIISGENLHNISESALVNLVMTHDVFVHLTPDKKERIILALKKSKQVVGYMGDGVNDATSLRAADVGISVENAIDVAKESADIILVTKSLRVLNEGIIEGRKTFVNTMKYIFMGTGSNFGNMFSVSIASLFLSFIPMLPIQILLNNLIYDMSQLSLPSDNVDNEDLIHPQKWDIKFIKRFILFFGPISSLFDLITFFILFHFFRASVPMFRTGWFVESLLTQSLIILAVRTKKVPFFKSIPSIYVALTALIAGAVGIVITQTGLGVFFQFIPLPNAFWLYIVLVLIGYFTMVEITKLWFYRKVL